jgi:MFS family permease
MVFALHAASIACLVIGQTPLFIALFVLSFGAAQGALTLTRPSLLAERYGVTHYGRISSVMTIFLTLTGTSGPLGASLIYDGAGSYQPVLWLVLGLAVLSTAVMHAAIRGAAVET